MCIRDSMIILARMFAGLFTGGIFVSFLTYIVNKSNPEDQGKYLTYSATIKSVASAFGYMIGGFLGESSVPVSYTHLDGYKRQCIWRHPRPQAAHPWGR